MPRIKGDHSRVRLTLETSEPVRKRLEDLRNTTEADSLSEVIRRALTIYETFVVRTKDEKCKVFVRDEDGSEREIVFL